MSLRINNNSTIAFSNYHLQKIGQALSESLTRLSAGKRINNASDDAAGMVIANTLESQAMGFGQAIHADISKNLESVKSIADSTSFNGQALLSGTFTGKEFQVGASSGEVTEISLGSLDPAMISDDSSETLAGIDVTTPEGARAAIGISDAALEYIGGQQSQVGSTQNQLESTIQNLTHSQISTLASASEIEDLDYAEESMEINRIKLLSQARAFAQAKTGDMAKHMVDIFG